MLTSFRGPVYRLVERQLFLTGVLQMGITPCGPHPPAASCAPSSARSMALPPSPPTPRGCHANSTPRCETSPYTAQRIGIYAVLAVAVSGHASMLLQNPPAA
jgi:hypothetical protein